MRQKKRTQSRKDRETKRKWHYRRIRCIVVLGLMIMLFLSVEYIRGGSSQVRNSVERAAQEWQKAARDGRQWIGDLLREAERYGIYKLEKSWSEDQEGQLSKGHMQVHFLDVGQADCTLIQTEEAAMLIDGGNEEDGEFVVDYLRMHGVERLDYVVGTHPHEDHIGGLDAVIREFEIETVILPDVSVDTSDYEELQDAVKASEALVVYAQPEQNYTLGDASFEVIAPWREYGEKLNNWSVGLRLVFGERAFVFTGDAEELAEIDIVESGQILRADVWKAGHHGSETSNSDWMLDMVDPDYAVVSCGRENRYGHPHKAVLRSFKERGIRMFRTDEQGTLIADCDGTTIVWKR